MVGPALILTASAMLARSALGFEMRRRRRAAAEELIHLARLLQQRSPPPHLCSPPLKYVTRLPKPKAV